MNSVRKRLRRDAAHVAIEIPVPRQGEGQVIDRDLEEEVNLLSRSIGGLSVLSPEATEALVERVSSQFSVDRSRQWWWEGLLGARVIECDTSDGLAALQRLLPQNEALALVVTDDEFPPWIAVSGAWPSLSRMLRETRLFEFFVVPDRLNWIVFSTHDSQLVVAGDLG
ncbi:MAG: hypothetical protein U0R24_00040 [Solirubrobacterales bacterium]